MLGKVRTAYATLVIVGKGVVLFSQSVRPAPELLSDGLGPPGCGNRFVSAEPGEPLAPFWSPIMLPLPLASLFGIAEPLGWTALTLLVLVLGVFLLFELLGVRYIPNNRVGIIEKLWSRQGSVGEGRIIA